MRSRHRGDSRNAGRLKCGVRASAGTASPTSWTRQRAPAGRYAEELQAACDAVRLAGTLCDRAQLSLLRREVHANTKGDSSLVTLADYGAQAIISHMLHQRFDNVTCVALSPPNPPPPGPPGICFRQSASSHDLLAFLCRLVAEESSEALCEGGEGGTDMLKRIGESVNDALVHGGLEPISSSDVRLDINTFQHLSPRSSSSS